MNRNTELHFANLPSVNIGRSKFDRSFTHKTTFNSGKLIPLFVDATIMPGDTVKMGLSEVVRMMTPICPVMDNSYMDIYFFFVPHRIVWNNFKKFMGENDSTPWTTQYTGKIPKLIAPIGNDYVLTGIKGWSKGSIADYFGIPTNVDHYEVNQLPFRAYTLIWNEFFRDENIQYPQLVEKGDTTIYGIAAGSSLDDYTGTYRLKIANRGGSPLPVCKLHDYFTSCLPNSQKGEPVSIPLSEEKQPVRYQELDYTSWEPIGSQNGSDEKPVTYSVSGTQGVDPSFEYRYEEEGETYTASLGAGEAYRFYVDLSAATGATVNQLRQAFAIQKFLERDARNGTRFIETIKSHFNVTNPDYRLQRPEYLGGKRIPINMNTVVQNSPTVSDTTTPLGTTGAYSVTSDSDNDLFTKSFTEWGTLMGLVCIRTDRTYQQGLNKQWSMSDKYDFYFPEFANLGEEPVFNKEIYLQGSEVINESTGNPYDEEAFGFQERWANYRYIPDTVSGELRSNYAQSLDIWHYADYYEAMPTLSNEWIEEDSANIERTLAVQNHDQFLGDFFFKATYTRPMPLYSVPGLIDHH